MKRFAGIFVTKKRGFWLAFVSGLLNLATPDFAQTVTLAWNANSEPNLRGYWVYFGTDTRSYETPIFVGNTNKYAVTNLQLNVKYFFAVTATNTAGLESDFSREVSTIITNTSQPVILSFSQGTIQGTGAPGQSYTLEATQDFAKWTPLTNSVFGANGQFSYDDPGFPGLPFRFYRAKR